MISSLDPASDLFLADLGRIQQQLATANSQVSSGKKINVASDAPDQISDLLQLRANRQKNIQIQANLNLAKADADTADNALASAIKLMDRAVVLGTQGANSTTDAISRGSLAQEVQSLHDQMVAYSQTTVQGGYVFSGDQDGGPAYVLDPTGANTTVYAGNGVDRLTTAPSTRLIEDPAGGSFAASKTAQEIFDLRNADGAFASGNVFAALTNLQNALTGGDTAAIATAVNGVKDASTHLNSVETFYGNLQNRIQDATAYAANYDTQLQTQISQKEDADITSAALALTQGSTDLQAAMEMRAKMPHTSLFDFLG